MTSHEPGELNRTRASLHGVAELLLAGPQFETSRRIELRTRPAGFGTVTEPDLRVEADHLVMGGRRISMTGRTYDEIGADAGVTPRRLDDVYSDGPGLEVGDEVSIDRQAALFLARAFQDGDTALRRFCPGAEPVLWPEHFDIAIEVEQVTYGLSPGDSFLDEPYGYVSVSRRLGGEFWNAPFGAARALGSLGSTSALEEFFVAGREAWSESGHGW